MNLDSKKINSFVGSLSDLETNYLKTQLSIKDSIKDLMLHYPLTKEELAKEFKIYPYLESIDNFITGNYNYDIGTIATINYLNAKMEERKFQESQTDQYKIAPKKEK